MRVALLATDLYGARGGISEFNRNLARGLAACTNVTDALAMSMWAAMPQEGVPEKTLWLPLPRRGKAPFAAGALAAVARFRPDVLLCGHVNLGPLAHLAKRLRIVKKTWTIAHGVDVWQPLGLWPKHALYGSDLVTTVSEYTRRRMLSWCPMPPGRTAILHNTVRSEVFTIGARPSHLLKRYEIASRSVLLTVGRLPVHERTKGHDRVIEALPLVLESNPDVLYLIVGQGPDRARLERLAAKVGVSERVLFVGEVPPSELPDHYRLADVFVMPSRREGFGIVYLEAACCGVPSIASKEDAGAEVMDMIGGESVDPNDIKALANAIRISLARSPEREALRSRTIDAFGFTRFSRRVQTLLESLA